MTSLLSYMVPSLLTSEIVKEYLKNEKEIQQKSIVLT